MIHKTRRFATTEYDDPVAMAHAMTERVWTLCSGFQHGGVTWLSAMPVVRASSLAEF